MARYVSDSNIVGFLYESGTYANPTGTTLVWPGLVTQNEVSETNSVKYVRFNGNATRNQSVAVDGQLNAEGKMQIYPQDWRFLALFLGSNVDAGVSPYTHTMSELNSSSSSAFTSGPYNPFFSFTVYDSQAAVGTGKNFNKQLQGCIVNTLQISASENGLTQLNVDYIGQSVVKTSGTPTTSASSTTAPFIWANWSVTLPDAVAQNAVKGFTFTANNNLGRRNYLNGSRVTQVPVPLNRDYTVSLTVDGQSETIGSFYDIYFKGGSEFNMTLVCADPAAGTGSRTTTIVLSGCTLDPLNTPTNNSDIVTNEQTLNIVPRTCSAVTTDLTAKYNPW